MMLGSVKKPVVGVTLTPDKKRYTEFVGWKKGTKTSELRAGLVTNSILFC